MIVEIDGTTSPQIMETEGITDRESLKQPTEYSGATRAPGRAASETDSRERVPV